MYSTNEHVNAFVSFQKFAEMGEIRIPAFFVVELHYSRTHFRWNSCCRLPPVIPVYEKRFALIFVTFDHAVYLPTCDFELNSSPIFVAICFDKLFYDFVFLLFIHPKIDPPDNCVLLSDRYDLYAYTLSESGHFHL